MKIYSNHTHVTRVVSELPVGDAVERSLLDVVTAALVEDFGADGALAKFPGLTTLGELRAAGVEAIVEKTGLDSAAVSWFMQKIGASPQPTVEQVQEAIEPAPAAEEKQEAIEASTVGEKSEAPDLSFEEMWGESLPEPLEPADVRPFPDAARDLVVTVLPPGTVVPAGGEAAVAAPPKAKSKFTRKQEKFIEEYLVDFNGAAAARRAGYSQATARQIAHELLTKPDVCRALEDRMGADGGVARPFMASILANIARAHMGDYVRVEDGQVVVDVSNLEPDQWAAVQEVQTRSVKAGDGKEAGTVTKIKLHDPSGALEKLARIMDKFTERRIHGVDDSITALLQQIDGRSRGL